MLKIDRTQNYIYVMLVGAVLVSITFLVAFIIKYVIFFSINIDLPVNVTTHVPKLNITLHTNDSSLNDTKKEKPSRIVHTMWRKVPFDVNFVCNEDVEKLTNCSGFLTSDLNITDYLNILEYFSNVYDKRLLILEENFTKALWSNRFDDVLYPHINFSDYDYLITFYYGVRSIGGMVLNLKTKSLTHIIPFLYINKMTANMFGQQLGAYFFIRTQRLDVPRIRITNTQERHLEAEDFVNHGIDFLIYLEIVLNEMHDLETCVYLFNHRRYNQLLRLRVISGDTK